MTEKPHLKPFRGTIVGAQSGLIAAAYVVGPVIGHWDPIGRAGQS